MTVKYGNIKIVKDAVIIISFFKIKIEAVI